MVRKSEDLRHEDSRIAREDAVASTPRDLSSDGKAAEDAPFVLPDHGHSTQKTIFKFKHTHYKSALTMSNIILF
jgi:hypothetical protein